ncbi:MAG: baseplate J/gp47 family protein [Candidatus Endonucleobacter bathymodioli]|uniref:Baseplate J/gp47 family protein n=1 Tax=Candidatus Endonucleibacter bathymodioli TaxID=539814 RepID=A0AA90NPF4_9GAMM|nr:baseplate J/gp47 family protein [Candidatus Endonucleobacter bathymodioli]
MQSLYASIIRCLDVGGSSGENLKRLARSIAGDLVNGGSKSVCDSVVFSGLAGATVPAGVVILDDNKVEWKTTSSVLIGDEVIARANKVGATALGIGKLTTLPSSVHGVSGVTNTRVAVKGRDKDSDSVIRRKVKKGAARFQRSGIERISHEVMKVSGVFDISLLHNRTSVVVDGVQPHSFAAIVAGGKDQEVLDAIATARSCGVGDNVGVSGLGIEVTGSAKTAQGRATTATMFRPTEVLINITIIVSGTNSSTHASLTIALKDSIKGYFIGESGLLPLSKFDQDGLLIGDDVSGFKLATPCNAVIANDGILDGVTVNNQTHVNIGKSELAVVTDASISVIYI